MPFQVLNNGSKSGLRRVSIFKTDNPVEFMIEPINVWAGIV